MRRLRRPQVGHLRKGVIEPDVLKCAVLAERVGPRRTAGRLAGKGTQTPMAADAKYAQIELRELTADTVLPILKLEVAESQRK